MINDLINPDEIKNYINNHPNLSLLYHLENLPSNPFMIQYKGSHYRRNFSLQFEYRQSDGIIIRNQCENCAYHLNYESIHHLYPLKPEIIGNEFVQALEFQEEFRQCMKSISYDFFQMITLNYDVHHSQTLRSLLRKPNIKYKIFSRNFSYETAI